MHLTTNYGPGNWSKDVIPGTKLRPDAVDMTTGIVYELKPNNPRAIARGYKQVQKYVEALRKAFPNRHFMGSVVTY